MFVRDSDPVVAFDFQDLLNDLRCHTSEWLEARREWLVREQRRLHVEELGVLGVLDERGAVDDSLAGRDGTRTRDVRRKRATASRLWEQPKLAEAAAKGNLSEEQLAHASDLAGDDPDEDERWAAQAPNWSPDDLAAEVRERRTPTAEDGAARRAARELKFWWRPDYGMLDGRFSLPDIDGAVFESVLNEMIEKMRPVKGQAWDTREHRSADALVELCRSYAAMRGDEAATAPAPHLIVQVPLHGPATVAGVPLPDAMVERLRAQAKVEPVLVDDDGEPIVVGRIESTLSEKTKRVVRQRDGKCRWPGCDQRVGLEVHHLWPTRGPLGQHAAMPRLAEKVVIITGAATGIGRAAAELFADEGARLVVADYAEEAGRATVAAIEAAGGEAAFVAVDVSDEPQVAAMVEFAVATYGSLDVLYNNAGIFPADDGGATETPVSTWDRVMDVNLKGVWLGCKHGIPAMIATGGGSIVNVASFVAHMGAATPQIAYTASKGGVLSLTREVAVEHARNGIRANALCPGPVETPLLAELMSDPDRRARRLVHIPMGRLGRAEELAKAALFLASDDSSFMTGASLLVDGGITAAYTTPE